MAAPVYTGGYGGSGWNYPGAPKGGYAAPSKTGQGTDSSGNSSGSSGSGITTVKTAGGPLYYGSTALPPPPDYSSFIQGINALSGAPLPTVDYGQINAAAGRAAQSDIANQLLGIHAEQQRLINQGTSQAKLINQMGMAAARLTQPWAQGVNQAYLDAAQQQGGMAKGFSGELQTTAQNASADLVNQLKALGSSQVPPVEQAPALANVSYGLGGVLPGDTLSRQGTLAYQAAQAIPQGFLGYQQQQALGAMGAAQQRAMDYQPDIIKALASQPQVTRDYASLYGTQAQQMFSNALDFRKTQIGTMSTIAGLLGKG